jgi:hypothetical protein
MEITLDLGHVPSVLAALSNPATMRRAVNVAAESYVDDVLDWIASGRSFTPHNGQAGLEGAIGWHPNSNNSAVVYANKDYADYVEHGTRPHVIRPKPGRKGLKIPVSGGGGYIVRRMVKHPGTRPMPFFIADMDARQNKMVTQVISVLAAVSGANNHG